MYEILKQNLTTEEFETTTVKSLGSGRRKVEKGQIEDRERTVVDQWQVVRITELEDPIVKVEEVTNDDGVALTGTPTGNV